MLGWLGMAVDDTEVQGEVLPPDLRDPQALRRGRAAQAPQQIPWLGWRDIWSRTYREARADRLSLLAAGMTFYAVVSLFPGLIALISVYGLIANPVEMAEQLLDLAQVLPLSAVEVLREQLLSLAQSSSTTLSLGLASSIFVALWSASSGVTALLSAINTAYDERERRSFLRLRATAILFVLGMIVFAIVALALTGGVTLLLRAELWGPTIAGWAASLRWLVLAVAVLLGLSLIYRYGPCRAPAKFRWLSVGTVVAAALWLAGTLLFNLYVSSFGKYNETYGALAGGIVLMMWLYLSNFAILLGAELNAEVEAQTGQDSTTGPPKPMGERNAVKADRLGPTSAEL